MPDDTCTVPEICLSWQSDVQRATEKRYEALVCIRKTFKVTKYDKKTQRLSYDAVLECLR